MHLLARLLYRPIRLISLPSFCILQLLQSLTWNLNNVSLSVGASLYEINTPPPLPGRGHYKEYPRYSADNIIMDFTEDNDTDEISNGFPQNVL